MNHFDALLAAFFIRMICYIQNIWKATLQYEFLDAV